MSNPTPEEVRTSIIAKSDQLNADDLVAGPLTVTIEKVTKGDKEQPIAVHLEGFPGRPYKPCKTCRRVLVASFTDDPKAWIGQRMTLFCDPNVTWAGVKVGGIRISHLSGISEPRVFVLTQTRGKKTEVTIMPLGSDGDAAYIADAKSEIAKAETKAMLEAIGFVLKGKPKAIQDALRPVYAARLKELGSDVATL